jgi:hypothetical protein
MYASLRHAYLSKTGERDFNPARCEFLCPLFACLATMKKMSAMGAQEENLNRIRSLRNPFDIGMTVGDPGTSVAIHPSLQLTEFVPSGKLARRSSSYDRRLRERN